MAKKVPMRESMPITFGKVQAQIFGGPFFHYSPERRLVGVKMAEEIDLDCEISIPTHDFSVPSVYDMEQGAEAAIIAIHHGNDLYAGCMGGTGRTGVFMGVMAKAMNDYQCALKGQAFDLDFDPVAYVRKWYRPHAIETSEQMAYVRNFDTRLLVHTIEELQKVRHVYHDVETRVNVVVYPPVWAYIKYKLHSLLDKLNH